MRGSAKVSRGIVRGLVVAFVCFGVVFTHASAEGQSTAPRGVTISPPLQQITIGPGLIEANTKVSVTNNTGHTLVTTVKALDFKALDEFGGISLGQAGVPIAKYGLANWMVLPNGNNLTLENGQSADIPVNIENRADLTPGGHYGAVVITAQGSGAQGSNNVGFNQQLVSLLFLKKLGGEHYGLQLQSMTVPKGPDVPVSATLRFKSTGNVYVVPRGFINVTDPKGKLVAKGIINPESNIIIQDTSRQFVTLLQPIGNSSLHGRYKITANYRYDGQTTFTTKTVYFNRGSGTINTLLRIIITGVILLLVVYLLQRLRPKKYKTVHKRTTY